MMVLPPRAFLSSQVPCIWKFYLSPVMLIIHIRNSATNKHHIHIFYVSPIRVESQRVESHQEINLSSVACDINCGRRGVFMWTPWSFTQFLYQKYVEMVTKFYTTFVPETRKKLWHFLHKFCTGFYSIKKFQRLALPKSPTIKEFCLKFIQQSIVKLGTHVFE